MNTKLAAFLTNESFTHANLEFKLVNEGDENFLAEVYEDYRLRMSVFPFWHYSQAGIRNKLRSFIHFVTEGSCMFTVTEIDPNHQGLGIKIGFAGLTWMDKDKTKFELNRVLRYSLRNQHYGRRILQGLQHLAFNGLNLDALHAENLSYNYAAQISLESQGFKAMGKINFDDTQVWVELQKRGYSLASCGRDGVNHWKCLFFLSFSNMRYKLFTCSF